jgi:predicted TIM-barrel enzyme
VPIPIEVRSCCSLPILIGSGITADNAHKFANNGAHGFIVGSYFKKDGKWWNSIDETKLNRLVDIVKGELSKP